MILRYLLKEKKEVETLILRMRIYTQGIEMEFSITKCAMLIMEFGTREIPEGTELANQEDDITF